MSVFQLSSDNFRNRSETSSPLHVLRAVYYQSTYTTYNTKATTNTKHY